MDNRVWRRANNPELSRHTWDTSIPTLVAPSHYFFYIDGQEAVQENWYNWQKRQQKTTTKRQRQGRWQGQWNNKRRLTLIDDSYSGALVFCFLYISDNRESQMMTWQSGVTLDIRRPALTLTGRSSFAGPGVMTLEKLAPLNSFWGELLLSV